MSDPHPGPLRRFGKAHGSLLFRPKGSPFVPNVAVNGTPSLALSIPPNSHPLDTQATGREADLRPGSCQVPLITRVRATLKSERPRLSFKSNQCKLGTAPARVSPVT